MTINGSNPQPARRSVLDSLLFESSPDCVKLLDTEGNLLGFNRNGQCVMEIADFSAIEGKPWHSLWPDESRSLITQALETARHGQLARFNAACPTANGAPKWWDVTVTPVADGHGPVEAILVVSRDITDLQVSKEEQGEIASRLRFMMEAAQVGEWDLDLVTGAARTSPLHDRCYGYTDPVPEWTYERFLQHVHPEDRERIEALLSNALAEQRAWSFECRVVWPDASTHWISALGSIYRSEGGIPTRLIGTIQDVTARKRSQALADGQKRALEMAVAGAPLHAILDVLTRAAEDGTGNAIKGSVLLISADGRHLHHGAGPSLDPAYIEAIDGVEIGPAVGSCGTAAFLGTPVVAADIATDHRWENYRDLALAHGLRSCWSQPILSSKGHVLGTLAAYKGHRWEPDAEEREAFSLLLSTATLVLDRHRETEERVAAEQGLRQLATELTAADRRKMEFLATLAHELRNPLAPIRNGLEILQLAGEDPSTIGHVRDMMARQVSHMAHLIDDLLDVARITSDKLELRTERVRLRTVVTTAVDTSLPLIEAANHALGVELPATDVWLDVDATRIAQVLSNLLNNAAKYTPTGGRITLSATVEGNDAVLSVRDTGVGLAPDALSAVFDMFTQVKGDSGHSQGGLGIGLTLVRRLVEMHGGQVFAASAGLGQGSVFTIRLPAVVAVGQPQPAAAEPASGPNIAEGQGLRILVVDDNVDAASSLSTLLGITGHRVRIAHTGRQALEVAAAFAPELVFLDIGLPDTDGYAVAHLLRQLPAVDGTVIVALTGWGTQDDRRRSAEAGFDHHLTKPADIAAIMAIVAAVEAPASAGKAA
ncbi:ATP-binding protein [Lysobacter korlensis]|uniref:histidine kinase n=1 Tax=Lysobacter korlensis TaxID=553636 RepID=A0ABV6RUR9_9GAMM